ncbi:hypothetical protein IF2G_06482 [Cordyceps javanica]|nr:hypothetical protein IF2G_06482 [Cordyceps javanica]
MPCSICDGRKQVHKTFLSIKGACRVAGYLATCQVYSSVHSSVPSIYPPAPPSFVRRPVSCHACASGYSHPDKRSIGHDSWVPGRVISLVTANGPWGKTAAAWCALPHQNS